MNIKDRRFGMFSLSTKILESNLGVRMALDVMSKCIVFRAEHLFVQDEIEYQAYCDLFDVVEHGEIIPKYTFIFSDGGEIVTVEKEK